MRSHLYSLLKFFIGWPLSLLALFFIGKTITAQIPTIIHNFHSLHIFLLMYGIVCFIIFYFLRSYIWYRVLRQYGYSLIFKESSYLWAMSELKRYIPGNIWSFLGRTVLFQQRGVNKKDIAKGLIIEAELFVLGSGIVSLLSLPFFFSHSYQGYEIFITFLAIIILLSYCFNTILIKYFSTKLQTVLKFILPSFSFTENFFLIGISILALFFFGLGNYFVISSVFYLNPKFFSQLIGVFDLAFVVGYLSIITPAGFGVREGIVLLSLTKLVSAGLAAFGALFSRLILLIAEVFFIFLSHLWYKTHNHIVSQSEKLIKKHPQVSLLTIVTACYTIYFTVVSFLRYDNFYTGRFDLGNMAQTVWNSLHGKIFFFTNPNGTEQISRLAFHADFILVLLAPFYALWQNPKMLLLIQTLVVAAGAFFVYIIARDVLKHRNLALLFSFIYLLNPSVQRANIYDFHAVTLVTTFFLATYYFFLKKRYGLFILFAFLAALCKEQIWLIIALFGLLVLFIHKKRILGVSIFFVSVAMFYFLFWYAIPKTLGSQHFALAYLSDFGDSPTQIIKSIIFSPEKILQTIMQPARLDYLKQLFMPLGYLSVLFPFFLIFAGPDFLIDLLSNNPQLHQIYYQYTATITPFIFLSAIYAVFYLRKLKFLTNTFSPTVLNGIIILYLLIFSFSSAYLYGPLPGAREPNLDMFTRQLPDRAFIDAFLKTIPKKYSVAASNDIGSHLSSRENIYNIPYGLDRADVIVLLLDGTDPQAKAAYMRVKKDKHYYEVVHKDGFVAFARK